MRRKGSNLSIAVQVTVWKLSYYKYLYDELLKEMKYIEENTDLLLPVKKWKRDILLLLLEKSQMPLQSDRKVLRKRITADIKTFT